MNSSCFYHGSSPACTSEVLAWEVLLRLENILRALKTHFFLGLEAPRGTQPGPGPLEQCAETVAPGPNPALRLFSEIHSSGSQPHPFGHGWPVAVFLLGGWSCVVKTQTMWPSKLAIFTMWPFTEKVADPWHRETCSQLLCLRWADSGRTP